GLRRRARVLCQHSSSTRSHGPARLPSSWNVRSRGLSWTVIRSISYTLARAPVIVGGDLHRGSCPYWLAPKSRGRAGEAKILTSPRKVVVEKDLWIGRDEMVGRTERECRRGSA